MQRTTLTSGALPNSNLFSEASFYLQKNYHRGGVVAQEPGKDARTAHATLHQDAEHPSFLEIPGVK